jgi:RsiW-degrading membrane proteinase PrsW (M82 family)
MLFLILFLACLPAIFWFFVFLREEKFDTIPKKLITKVFILGGLSGLLAVALQFVLILGFPQEVTKALFESEQIPKLATSLALLAVLLTVGAAAIEEVVKIYTVKVFAMKSFQFNQVVDGAVLGVSAGLGFATLENVGYFVGASFEGVGPLIVVFIVRFLATTLLHAIATGIAGYYLGKAKFEGRSKDFWVGLFAAVLIHATFNILLMSGIVLGLLINIFLLLGMLSFLLTKMDSTEAQTIWKLVVFKKSQS